MYSTHIHFGRLYTGVEANREKTAVGQERDVVEEVPMFVSPYTTEFIKVSNFLSKIIDELGVRSAVKGKTHNSALERRRKMSATSLLQGWSTRCQYCVR